MDVKHQNPNGIVMVPIKIKTKILKKIVVIGASSSSKINNREFAGIVVNSLKLNPRG